MANLINHERDFNLKAEWRFSTTAHGKSAFDGIGYRALILCYYLSGKNFMNSEKRQGIP